MEAAAEELAAYYTASAEHTFVPSRATESPWNAAQQHGGPSLALAAHVLQRAFPQERLRPVRITLDFLGAIPLDVVAVVTQQVRPGARIDLTMARLEAQGRAYAEVRLWRVRHDAELAMPLPVEPFAFELPPAQPQVFFEGLRGWGYGEATEWRWVSGGMHTPGEASVWTRVRGELVAGRELTPLERALVVADSANGVSSVLPLASWLYVPTSISVSFARDPAGEWLRLDARTTVGPDGRGVVRGALFDRDGFFATIDQALYVARR